MSDLELTNQGEPHQTPVQKDERLEMSVPIPELPEEPLLDVDADLSQSLTHPEVDSSEEREEIDMDNINNSEFDPPREPSPPVPPPPTTNIPPVQASIPDSEERTWAMLAHLSILLNLVSGFLGPVAAFIIYLVYKDKSRYVAYQSLQAFVFQLIWWVGAGAFIAVMWVFVGLLSAVVIGLCLIPFAILISLIPLAALVYGVVGGIHANQGDDFRYWLIGDWLRGTLTGS
jgi:hypothetical protein